MPESTETPPAPPGFAAGGYPAASANWLTGRRATLVFVGIFLSLVMGALDNFVVLTALTNITNDLGSPSGAAFVVSSYLIASTIAIPVFGKLSDILSRRNVFLVALAVFVAGSILAGLSQNLGDLIVFRGIQGFGNGGFFPVGLAIIGTVFSPEQRARVTGILSGVFAIGTVAGPFLGSFIVDHTTWRWVFYVNIPVGVLGMAVIAGSLGALRPLKRGTFDILGAALLSLWVGTFVLPLYEVSQSLWSWTDARTIVLLLGSLPLFAGFVYWQLRANNPLVPLRLFSRTIVAANGAIALLRGFAFFSLTAILSIYVGFVLLHNAPGSSDSVRDVLYFLLVPMVVAAGMAGQLLTRVAYRPLVAFGLGVGSVGFVLLSTVTGTTPIWTFSNGFLPTGGLILPLIPIGFGIGLTFAATVIAVQFQVPPQEIGAATSLVTFLQSLGGAIGISLFTSLYISRATALQPSVPTGGCAPGSFSPACLTYFQNLTNSNVAALDDVFKIMLVCVLVAFAFSLMLSGRMPKRAGASPAAGAA
ncbi:MAG TPA: MFS transporter [Thermoplasmata archaeon]|nr:MFS transporter [Thermoplasmata archaeon]